METLLQDLRYTVRTLVRAPSFTVAAVLTLALGIGANTAMFAVVYGVLLRPLPYPEAEKLYLLFQSSESVGRTRAAPLDFLDWQERTRTFAGMAGHVGTGFTLTGGAEPELVIGQLVSAELFEVLRVRPMLGRTFRPDENEAGLGQVVILSHGLWARRFGADPNVIGRTMTANAQSLTIVGVMPPGFAYPSTRYELWAPFPFRGTNSSNLPVNRESRYLQVVGRLRPGVTSSQAAADMTAVGQSLARQFPDTHADRGIEIASLLDDTVGAVRRAVWLIFAGAGLVLLIACTNVTSLLLARFSVRERELGVRTALGAGRWRLARQFLVETLVLYGIAGIAGVLLAYWLLQAVIAFAPADLPRIQEIGLFRPVLAFSFVTAFLAALVFGLAPSWQALRGRSSGMIQGLTSRGTAGGPRQHRARSAVLVAQIALAVVLVTGATLVGRSLLNLARVQKGFDPTDVVTFDLSLPAERFPDATDMQAFYSRFLQRFESHGLFEAVGVTTHLPLSGQDLETGFTVEGYDPPTPRATPIAGLRGISPGYLAAMGIPIRRGRNINAADRQGGQPVVLINESFAHRYWPGTEALGARLSTGESDPWRTVVGIVADVKHRGLDADARPEVLIPFLQLDPGFATAWARGLSIVLRSNFAPESVVASIKHEMSLVDPALPVVNPRPMAELVTEALGQPWFRTLLLSAFGFLALVLAFIGTLGLMSYFVSQRRHEFAVRIALGATSAHILRSVVLQGARVVSAGLAIGAAAALALTRSMQAVLYGVRSNDLLTFLAAIALLGMTGVVACYTPARRAARVDPMIALRAE